MSWTTVYLHTSVEAGADQAFPRGGKGRVSLGLEGRGDLVLFGPTYTFTTPLLGGYMAVSAASLDEAGRWAEQYIRAVGADEVDLRELE